MGFGTLFAGYFLILNFAYYRFTDAVAAVVMLYALYKLSGVNSYFKLSTIGAGALTLFGIYELVIAILEMLGMIGDLTVLNSVSALIRHFILAATTALMLMGMRDVAREVDLPALSRKCNYLAYVTVAVYTFNIILETSSLESFIDQVVLVYLAALSIIATLALIIVNLTAIFGCYYRICMPEDNTAEYTEKKSRFSFVNAFRAHEEEKQKEYAEYKLDKLKKKAEKQRQKSQNKK